MAHIFINNLENVRDETYADSIFDLKELRKGSPNTYGLLYDLIDMNHQVSDKIDEKEDLSYPFAVTVVDPMYKDSVGELVKARSEKDKKNSKRYREMLRGRQERQDKREIELFGKIIKRPDRIGKERAAPKKPIVYKPVDTLMLKTQDLTNLDADEVIQRLLKNHQGYVDFYDDQKVYVNVRFVYDEGMIFEKPLKKISAYDFLQTEDVSGALIVGSDVVAGEMRYTRIISFSLVYRKNKGNNKNKGEFFRYFNNSCIDLTKYQIYEESKKVSVLKEYYKENCFVYALIQSGKFKKEIIDRIKLVMKVRKISLITINKLCEKFKFCVNYVYEDPKTGKQRRYPKVAHTGPGPVIELALYKEHWFLNCPSGYTKFSLHNYKDLQDLLNFGKYGQYVNGNPYVKKSAKILSSFQLVRELMKMGKFDLMTDISSTIFYTDRSDIVSAYVDDFSYRLEEFKPNHHKSLMRKEKNKYVKCSAKKSKGILRPIFYADFEAEANHEKKCVGEIKEENRHRAYMLCFAKQKSKRVRTIWGGKCAFEFLDMIPNLSIVYFHNLKYDFNFLYEECERIHQVKNGSTIYSVDVVLKGSGKMITFRDSYTLIPSALACFNKMFNLGDVKKEIMPYELYTVENCRRKCHIDEVKPFIKEDQWEEFLIAADPYIKSGGVFDKAGYAEFYCKRDVEVLKNGMLQFRKDFMTVGKKMGVEIDIYNFMSISAISKYIMLGRGNFDEVCELGGMCNRFIQKCVIGGRTMCGGNEVIEAVSKEAKEIEYFRNRQECKEEFDHRVRYGTFIQDFDAVSLYPSAMYEMDGFPKGSPKVIDKFTPDLYTSYYVKIRITKIGKKMRFPLMHRKDYNGSIQYVNQLGTIYADKYYLEDLIKYQRIEYEFIEGIYFNEGWNDSIKETIKYMFDERLIQKKLKNPIQLIYKLLMNSAYGKTIMKPVMSQHHIIEDTVWEKSFCCRNHNTIKNAVKCNFSDKWFVETAKPINDHFSYPQVGTLVLSYSKRIMNRVFGVCDELGIEPFYQDTDSIQLFESDVDKLEIRFREIFKRELIGKNLGQMHCDYDLNGSDDPVAIHGVYIAKKLYCCKLQDRNDPSIFGYHIRGKGITKEAIYATIKRLGYANPIELYQDLAKIALFNKNLVKDCNTLLELKKLMGKKGKSKSMLFDLTDGRVQFKQQKGYISTLGSFVRKVSPIGFGPHNFLE